MLFGLLAPLLILAVAFGIDVTAWYRDALHLQGLADRAAQSAGPLWHDGDRAGAAAVVAALVAADDVTASLDYAGNPRSGRWAGNRQAIEIIVSGRQQHLLAGLYVDDDDRQAARAVALAGRLVE